MSRYTSVIIIMDVYSSDLQAHCDSLNALLKESDWAFGAEFKWVDQFGVDILVGDFNHFPLGEFIEKVKGREGLPVAQLLFREEEDDIFYDACVVEPNPREVQLSIHDRCLAEGQRLGHAVLSKWARGGD